MSGSSAGVLEAAEVTGRNKGAKSLRFQRSVAPPLKRGLKLAVLSSKIPANNSRTTLLGMNMKQVLSLCLSSALMAATAFGQAATATNAPSPAATADATPADAPLPSPRLYVEAGVDRDVVMPGKTYLRGYADYADPKAPPRGRRGGAAPPPRRLGRARPSPWFGARNPGREL